MSEDYTPPIYEDEFVSTDEIEPVELVSASTLEHYQLRRRLLAGDHDGIDLVERLRFAAERSWYVSVHIVDELMLEAAEEIDRLRAVT